MDQRAGSSQQRDQRPPAFCVVGLGNPGEPYTGTRHNVGFRVVDLLAGEKHTDIRRPRFWALTAEADFGRTKVFLMKPQTFMNRSGRSVAQAVRTLDIPAENVVVVYDDLDLPVGRLRVRAEGGPGGHRGVSSIVEDLGTTRFPRIRVGIGRPEGNLTVVEHVLSPYAPGEEEAAAEAERRAAEAVACAVELGVKTAMDRFNAG